MIKWRSGLAGIKGAAKRLVKGVLSVEYTANSDIIEPAVSSFGVQSRIDESGQGVTGVIDSTGQGVTGLITSSFGVNSLITDRGQGVIGLIDDTGQGVTGEI